MSLDLLPNTTGSLQRKSARNGYGEYSYGAAATVPCAVVHLNKKTQKTSVRTDQSASRGNAEEFISMSKILFPTSVAFGIDDQFTIMGLKHRIVGYEPRLDVLGNHDHNEVDMVLAQ